LELLIKQLGLEVSAWAGGVKPMLLAGKAEIAARREETRLNTEARLALTGMAHDLAAGKEKQRIRRLQAQAERAAAKVQYSEGETSPEPSSDAPAPLETQNLQLGSRGYGFLPKNDFNWLD
jgi:hypothetical protein